MGIAKYEFEARNIEVDKDAGPLRSGASESTGFLNGLDHLNITSPFQVAPNSLLRALIR